MLDNCVSILVLLIVSIAVPSLAVFVGHRVGPQQPTPRKAEPYEPGLTTIGPARRQVPVKLYRIVALYVVFDTLAISLLPWGVLFLNADARPFLFVALLVFMAILFVGFAYVWKTGALEWD
jgi:NADH-quinone oxidoreductase subunit A